jgi:hypothetical protein
VKWIEAHSGRWNIYFTVNEVTKALGKKASQAQIKAAVCLHVDMDPRPIDKATPSPEQQAEHLQKERARILKRISEYDPKPSYIIDSGGGYQAFWMLNEPFVMNGQQALSDEIAERNKQLETELEGDRCHNVDRIMRLPGTINVPDAKKTRAGRKPVLARLLPHDDPVPTYDLARFRRVTTTQMGAGRSLGGGGSYKVEISGNIARIDDLDTLPEGVTGFIKVLVVQGTDPDNPNRWGGDRSKAVIACVCGLLDGGCTDEQIYSLITDPDYAISAHVLEAGKNNVDRYAKRQIARAREMLEDPRLREMNEKHAVISNYGGKCCVLSSTRSSANFALEVQTFQTIGAIQSRYANRHVEVGNKNGHPITKSLGQWWIAHPKRRQYEGVIYAPGNPNVEIDGYFNLWRGWGVTPAKGDWSLLRLHILEVLAAGSEQYAAYITRWVANALQHPDRPSGVALVLRGRKGTGKGLFCTLLTDLFGAHGIAVSNSKHVTGHFNGHLKDKSLLFADEALAAEDKQGESVLKCLITEREIIVEQKGFDAVPWKNCLNIIMASNAEWVVPASSDERRFAVFDVADHRSGDYSYFAALAAELNGGGQAAFLHDLLHMDLTGFDPREVPNTVALAEQKQRSLSPFDAWWLSLLHDGYLPDAFSDRSNIAPTNGPNGGLLGHARRTVPALAQETVHRLTRNLKARGCLNFSDGNQRGWKFPPLVTARADWQRKFGANVDWDTPSMLDWGSESKTEGGEVAQLPIFAL